LLPLLLVTDEPARDALSPRGFLLLVPPLVLLGLLVVFRTWNVVWGDGVSMCPIFDKFYRSTLTFSDLWEPYQGHRIFFHRALELLLGWATHWNVNVEIGFVYVTFVSDFCLLCWLLQDLPSTVSVRVRMILAMMISLSVFSASQLEIWTNGFNIGMALSAFSVVTGLTILAKFGPRFWALLGCIAAGVVASYSFGNGIVYWGALVPLLYCKLRNDPRWLGKSVLWATAAATTILFYFYRLGGTGGPTPLGQAVLNSFRMPGTFLRYLLTCAGADIFFLNGAKANLPVNVRLLVACGAPICGLAGLVALGWSVWRLSRRANSDWTSAAPWLSLGLYGVFSVGTIAITRYTFLPESAISSRYILFSQYLWLSLFVLLALLSPRLSRGWWWMMGGILTVCYLISYGNGLRRAREISSQLRQIRMELLSQPTEQTYHLINPNRDPAQVASFMEMNRHSRLATFEDAAVLPTGSR
jgi:hypothetical protein